MHAYVRKILPARGRRRENLIGEESPAGDVGDRAQRLLIDPGPAIFDRVGNVNRQDDALSPSLINDPQSMPSLAPYREEGPVKPGADLLQCPSLLGGIRLNEAYVDKARFEIEEIRKIAVLITCIDQDVDPSLVHLYRRTKAAR